MPKFAAIRVLFGMSLDDAPVVAFLATCGKHSKGKPDSSGQFVIAKPDGFDLLFRKRPDAKRTDPRVLHSAFLYAEGKNKHTRFADPPFGLAYTDRTDVLERMGKPERSWKIGPGEVPVTAEGVSHDTWKREGLKVSVQYGKDETVSWILVSAD